MFSHHSLANLQVIGATCIIRQIQSVLSHDRNQRKFFKAQWNISLSFGTLEYLLQPDPLLHEFGF